MRALLIGCAAALAALGIAAPAAAGTPEEPFTGNPNANLSTFGGFQPGGGPVAGQNNGRFDHRRGGNSGVWINGGEWARYNNPSFQSDSYNDWWHDRPDRAYPAWVRNNQNCARQWFAGNILRC